MGMQTLAITILMTFRVPFYMDYIILKILYVVATSSHIKDQESKTQRG